MKNFITSIFAIVLLIASGTSLQAQSTIDGNLEAKMAEGTITGAQLGSLICENANGERVLCSGSIEESVLGIVTNVPYVTLNKPSSTQASKFVFDSFVSADNGAVNKGDYLVAGAGGSFVKAESASLAYAIALEEVQGGQKMIRVKLLSK